MALDGETNLKMKRPLVHLAEACQSPEAISKCRARFTVEDPNINLYNFDGKVRIGAETAPLTNTEMIYRGSVLRNTSTASGLVIFTGEECKIRMNANKNPRIKAPALQAVVNRVVIIVVLIVLALAIFNSAAYEVWQRTTESKSWYLKFAHVAFGPIFTSFIIMFNTMIPLSLYVSLEIVKLCQMFLMNDVDMYDEDSDTPMEARTSTINEELGQVSYIFSDKTGTLTDNCMRFRKMSIAGTAWLHDQDLQEEAQHSSGKMRLLHKKRNNKGKERKNNLSSFGPNRQSSRKIPRISASGLDGRLPSGMSTTWKPSTGHTNALYGGRSEEMLEYIQRRPHTMFAQKARLFILSMALCHTCVPEKDEDGNVTFQAASPDELALVNAAQDLGYVVVNRLSNSITIKVFLSGTSEDPSYESFEVLDIIEFSSARKRMSVIVRMPDQRICIFCKGADSTVTGLLRMSDLASTLAADIERNNSQRKSLEAEEALRRRSHHVLPSAGNVRNSFSFPRPSADAVGTCSTSLGRKGSTRDTVDQWLRDRETDIDMRDPRDSAQYYSPRLSQQPLSPDLSNKISSFMSGEEQSPLQIDDYEHLVDETLVVNDELVIERCFQHINDFATEGLRTLMYGYRQILSTDNN
jgi:phospholipid-translocating ATPase